MIPTHLHHQRFLHLQSTFRIPPTRPPGPLSPLTPRGFPLQHLRSLALPRGLLRTCWPVRETLRTPSRLLEVQTLERLGGMLVTTWQTLGGVLPIWSILARSSIRPGRKNQPPASRQTSPTLTQPRSCSRGFSSCRSNHQKELRTRPSSRALVLMCAVSSVSVQWLRAWILPAGSDPADGPAQFPEEQTHCGRSLLQVCSSVI